MHGFACVLLHTTNYNHTHPTPTTHKKVMTTPLLINNAATLLLPPQALNTHQKTSHRSHTTTKSTTTPLPTNHCPLNTPQNLSSPTTQTNWHHTYKPIISRHTPHHLPYTSHTKLITPSQTTTQSTANQHNFIHKTTSSNKNKKIHKVYHGK